MIKLKNTNYSIASILVLVVPILLLAKKEVYVDLSLQRAYAMENGLIQFEGRISSGKTGHETPTGEFEILQKKISYKSNIYPKPNGGAKMPYMMRLTWDGVAMHQGYVPRKPASHGCIRLRKQFAKKLFYWVKKGTKVTIEGDTYSYTKSNPHPYSKDRDGYSTIEVY